jgi:hypothetical protein
MANLYRLHFLDLKNDIIFEPLCFVYEIELFSIKCFYDLVNLHSIVIKLLMLG